MISFIIFTLLIVGVQSLFTTIPQGYVGVYYWFNQIQPNLITGPTFFMPIIGSISLVKYIEDADEVFNIKCVSKEGVDINIKSIQIANEIDRNNVIDVVTRFGLDYDKKLVTNPLEQKMREICANMTVDELEIHRFYELDDLLKSDIQEQAKLKNTGIIINWVRVTGINVPVEIKAKRLALASEKAEKILVEEQNKRALIIKEQEEIIAKKDAEIRIQKAKSHNEELLMNMQAEQQRKSVEFSILVDEGRARAEKIKLEADALLAMDKLNNYYSLEKTKAFADGTKMIYWGDSLPKFIISSDMIQHNQ
jgi:regulator of protease activity HflC (stomatin/prohibitin superfamily)